MESVVQPAPEVVHPAPEPVPVVEMPPKEEPEVVVLGQSGDLEQVAPNATTGATGIVSASEGGPGAGPSEGLPAGGEGAMVQHGISLNFNRNEWEEEEVCRA